MRRMSLIIQIVTALVILIVLPLSGVYQAGLPLDRYLEFPPETQYVDKAPFSVTAFFVFVILIVSVTTPLIVFFLKNVRLKKQTHFENRFPIWGWIGCGLLVFFWILAWTRFPWFAPLQEHSYVPLWYSFIVVINALTFKLAGRCMLTHQKRLFYILFPCSALFWWFFEYLNRFVQNWYYTGVEHSAIVYFLLASLAFSTVLPAVLGIRDLLLTFFEIRFEVDPSRIPHRRTAAAAATSVLILSAACLFLIGIHPDYLFPMLWVSPLLVITCLRVLFREQHILQLYDPLMLNRFFASMTAALISGFFWEMWNYFSLVKWKYDIPFVDRFEIFEMPVLGYAGYLPFGLECLAIGLIVERALKIRPPGWKEHR